MIRRDFVGLDESDELPEGRDDFQFTLRDIGKAVDDVLGYLAGELILDRGLGLLQRSLTRMGFPNAAAMVAPIAVGAQLGYVVGGYAGERSAGGTFELWNEGIGRYESSALGSTRII